MNKLVVPVILVSITLVAGIFAFMPVEKASTVHTTIQGTQLTEIASVIDTELKTNTTAGCGADQAGLVYYTFSNNTIAGGDGPGAITSIVLDIDGGGGAAGITLQLGGANNTSVSGVIGVTAGNSANFGFDVAGSQDRGDVHATALCQVSGVAAASAN